MATIYLTEQGAKLRKTSRRIVVEKEKQVLLEVPEFKVDRVLIFGNIQITTQAMSFLLDNGIDMALLSMNGKFRGRLSSIESKNIILRIKQYKRYHENSFRLELARSFVFGKLNNAKTILMKYGRNHHEVKLGENLRLIESCLGKVRQKETVNSLIGIEGIAAASYFRAFGQMFRKELSFKNRQKYPARDPINALLSFGYTILSNEILSLLSATGFEPYIGFLHGISYGRPSLAMDVIEEFRPSVIDRFTLSLINNRIIQENDFEEVDGHGVFLKANAKKRYFMQYEKYLTKENRDTSNYSQMSYRQLLKDQIHKLARTILEGIPYVAHSIRS